MNKILTAEEAQKMAKIMAERNDLRARITELEKERDAELASVALTAKLNRIMADERDAAIAELETADSARQDACYASGVQDTEERLEDRIAALETSVRILQSQLKRKADRPTPLKWKTS